MHGPGQHPALRAGFSPPVQMSSTHQFTALINSVECKGKELHLSGVLVVKILTSCCLQWELLAWAVCNIAFALMKYSKIIILIKKK